MRILITAFSGTMADKLLMHLCDRLPHEDFAFLRLPTAREESVHGLCRAIVREKGRLRYIVSLAQKEECVGRIHVETCARARDGWFQTDFPVAKWMLCAAACGLPAYLSQNAGTMYANHLYAEGLRFLRDDPAYRCQMLLCHVPMAEDGTAHGLSSSGEMRAYAASACFIQPPISRRQRTSS